MGVTHRRASLFVIIYRRCLRVEPSISKPASHCVYVCTMWDCGDGIVVCRVLLIIVDRDWILD